MHYTKKERMMPIPAEILAVERPKNTRVKKSGDRYLVIKRTCKYVDGRNVPVELGTIGEIVNGSYVEKRKEPRPKGVDIKDYGEVALCDDCGKDLLRGADDLSDEIVPAPEKVGLLPFSG